MKLKNLFGEFSGSIGAMTFSRNRYGFYVKNRSNPVNPNTQKQLIARQSFAEGASFYRTLNENDKSLWSLYGENVFISRAGKQGIAGIAAATALRQGAKMAALIGEISGVTSTPSGGAIGEIQLPDLPPDSPATALLSSDTAEIYVSEVEAIYSSAGLAQATLTLSGEYTRSDGQLTDANGRRTGFAVFRSQDYASAGGFANVPENRLVIAAPMITTLPSATTTIRISSSEAEPISAGRFVRLTVYAIDEYGQFALVGAGEAQVS